MRHNLALLIALCFVALGQSQTELNQFVPSNPNVSSLFKSTLTPAGDYSGSTNINIPFYTMSEGLISIPIAINYATGGIQVGEEASTIGLGWSLSAGGAITRVVNGVDDFDSDKGLLNTTKVHPDFPSHLNNPIVIAGFWNSGPFVESLDLPGTPKEHNCIFITNGDETFYDLPPKTTYVKDDDFMHDTFMYNFDGRSGSFVLTKTDNFAYHLMKTPIKIWYEGSGSGIYSNVVFKVLTEDGTLYSFKERGVTRIDIGNIDHFVSEWHLSEILDLYGNKAIFNYNSDNYYYPFRTFSQAFFATQDVSANVTSYFSEIKGPVTRVDDILLTSIEILKNGQKVQEAIFEYSIAPINGAGGERKDLDSRFLKAIKVFNNVKQDPIEQIEFHQSYFGSEQSYTIENISLTAGDFGSTIDGFDSKYPHLNLRLKLDSIVNNNLERYKFNYYVENTIPNKTSMSQDYWGFYNGKLNPEVFIPDLSSWQANTAYVPQQKRANRLPSTNHARLFSLKSIQYPTKGTTEYEYELNTFDQETNAIPVATTRIPHFASSPGPGNSKIIAPNQDQTLTVRFGIALTGWNEEKSMTRFGTPKPPEPEFANMFFAQLEKASNGMVVYKVPLSNYSPDYSWADLQNNYTNILKEEEVVNFSYAINTPFHLRLDEDEYVLRAVFNDDNGLYYGQAHVSTEIDQIDVSGTEKYSVGGGLRIAKITNKDNDGAIVSENVFNYHYQELDANNNLVTKSYGKVKAAPNFALDKRTVWNRNIMMDGDISNLGAMPLMLGAAGSQTPWSRDMGSFVGYDKVESFQTSQGISNGKVVKSFFNQTDSLRTGRGGLNYWDDYHKFPVIRVPHNGVLRLEEVFNRNGDLLSSKEYKYTVNGLNAEIYSLEDQISQGEFILSASKELPFDNIVNDETIYYFCDAMKFQLYPHYSNLIQQIGSIQTEWDVNGNNPVTTVQEFKYENPTHLQRTESKMSNTSGEEVITKTYYADDVETVSSLGSPSLTSAEKDLIDRFKRDTPNTLHRVAEAIQTETFVNGNKSVNRTYYKDWDSTNQNSYKVWPEFVKSLKGNFHTTDNPMENRLNFHLYDDYGNPVEVSKQDGSKISYVWGYDGKYPVAKVENASRTQILSTTANFTTINNSETSETQMKTELHKLRTELPAAMVTTYVYDPLVGVTSVTDPRGETITFIYDQYNRLQEIKDSNGNLVSDYKYHYKGQIQP